MVLPLYREPAMLGLKSHPFPDGLNTTLPYAKLPYMFALFLDGFSFPVPLFYCFEYNFIESYTLLRKAPIAVLFNFLDYS